MVGVDETADDFSDTTEGAAATAAAAGFVTNAKHDTDIEEVKEELRMLKELMDQKIHELQVQVDYNAQTAAQTVRPKEERAREGLTSKRAFSQLPSYSGKPEEYEAWSFQVRRFLSEEKDFKELMFKLKKRSTIPSKIEVENLFEEMNLAEADKEWMNHQLFQFLCLNLKGKALKSVQLLDEMEMAEVNGVIGWCKLAYDTSAMTSQRLQGLADQVYAPRRCKKYLMYWRPLKNGSSSSKCS